jgi:hypothetical protein
MISRSCVLDFIKLLSNRSVAICSGLATLKLEKIMNRYHILNFAFFSYPINTNSGELKTGIVISVVNFFESGLSLY